MDASQSRRRGFGDFTENWVAYVLRFLMSLGLSFIPAVVSIYNPGIPQRSVPFMPDALQGVMYLTLIAVPLVWVFAFRWSARLVRSLFLLGLALTAVAIIVAVFSNGENIGGWRQLTIEIVGSIAIPCVSLFGLIKHPGEDS